jgi:WD40 repeat protein
MKIEPVSPRLIRTLVHPDRDAAIFSTSFNKDGKSITGLSVLSGKLQIWNTTTGEQVRTISTSKDARFAVFAPDGKTAYVPVQRVRPQLFEKSNRGKAKWSTRGEIQIWDLLTEEQRPSLVHSPQRAELSIDLSPDGSTLVAVERVPGDDGYGTKDLVTQWDVTARTSRPLTEGFGMPTFSPDGKTLAITVSDYERNESRVKLFDVATTHERAILGEVKKSYFGTPSFSPDGRLVAASLRGTGEQPAEVKLWEVATAKEVSSFTAPKKSRAMIGPTFSHDGRWLAASLNEGFALLYDVAERKLSRTYQITGSNTLRGLAFSPDDRWLAIAGMQIPSDLTREEKLNANPVDWPQPRVFLIDLTTESEPEVLICPHGVAAHLAFSPDSRTLALGGYGCVLLFDTTQHSARR